MASKRYALANVDGGEVEIRKCSQHGLGAFEAPVDPATGRRMWNWERELWAHLNASQLGLARELPGWSYQTALTQVRISTPEQQRWFARYNAMPGAGLKPYEEAVKPFGFLSHAVLRPMTALADGRRAQEVCLIAPAGERRRFVDRRSGDSRFLEAGVDFTPQSYGDLIAAHHLHPERKFAESDGRSCSAETRGLLHDRPVRVARVKHVGKEGNELEEHQAKVTDEIERLLEYHDSWFDDLVAALRTIQTKTIAEATGFNARTFRRLKRAEFHPSVEKLSRLATLVSEDVFARSSESR